MHTNFFFFKLPYNDFRILSKYVRNKSVFIYLWTRETLTEQLRKKDGV